MADQFLPHAVCYLWDRGLLALHAVTDVLIGLSYVAISTTLAVLVQRARRDIPFHWIFLAFGAFIVACGATHLMEVWTLWSAAYWTAGGVKVVTALASVATAIVLPPLVPKALELIRHAKLREQLYQERAMRVDAEAANRTKDEFLATLSHELRTPLNAVYGWTRLLRNGELDAMGTHRALETIERNAYAQVRLIDDLLDVSRIIMGKMRLDVGPMSLREVTRAAVDSVRPAAEAKRIAIEARFDPGADRIAGDPDRLQQVIWNLVVNAVKFTPHGGRVVVGLRRAEAEIVLSVADTGQGIAPDLVPYVFDRFRQGESGVTRQQGGLGIGLALVRHLVELHGGSVKVESAGLGRGATFTVVLPIAATPNPSEDHWRVPMTPPLGVVPSLHGRRVLVVDDEPDSLELARVALTRHGADVRTETSTTAATAAMAAWPPDVLLCDLALPGQDGFAFIRSLRRSGNRTPAAALTAYGRGEDRVRAFAAGFDRHIAKPVEPDTLALLIAELLDSPAAKSLPDLTDPV